MKKRTFIKRLITAFSVLIFLTLVFVFGVDFYVKASVRSRILSPQEAADIEGADCILVLGCGVWGDKPSPMLEDRLLRGIELYGLAAAPKMIMSGDHGRIDYDEVNVMKQFAVARQVPSSDVFMDHAGFSTYESMVRAKEVFGVQKVIIVTQEYHLYRALYIAKSLGLEAYGVSSDQRSYAGQTYRDLREILARDKDFLSCIFLPKPTFLGEAIPVSGNGDVTAG